MDRRLQKNKTSLFTMIKRPTNLFESTTPFVAAELSSTLLAVTSFGFNTSAL